MRRTASSPVVNWVARAGGIGPEAEVTPAGQGGGTIRRALNAGTGEEGLLFARKLVPYVVPV